MFREVEGLINALVAMPIFYICCLIGASIVLIGAMVVFLAMLSALETLVLEGPKAAFRKNHENGNKWRAFLLDISPLFIKKLYFLLKKIQAYPLNKKAKRVAALVVTK